MKTILWAILGAISSFSCLASSPAEPQPEKCYKKKCEKSIFYNGVIDQSGFLKLKEQIEEHDVTQVVFNSKGGSLDASFMMGDYFRENGIHTAVNSGMECSSACVYAFSGGSKRTISKEAKIGVHLHVPMVGRASFGPTSLFELSETERAKVPEILENPDSSKLLAEFPQERQFLLWVGNLKELSRDTLEVHRVVDSYLYLKGIDHRVSRLILNTPNSLDNEKANFCYIQPACFKDFGLDTTSKKIKHDKQLCEISTPIKRTPTLVIPACMNQNTALSPN